MNHRQIFNLAKTLASLTAVAFLAGCSSSGGAGSVAPGHQPPAGGNPPAAGQDAGPVFAVKMQPQAVVEAPKGVSFASPAELGLPAPDRLPAAGEELTRSASEYEPGLFSEYVTANPGPQTLTFNPEWSGAGLEGLAYSTYRFVLGAFSGEQTIGINWLAGEEPEDWAKVHVALANFTANRWDWFEGPWDSVLTIDGFADYSNSDGVVYLVVAMTGNVTAGDAPATLETLQIGQAELRGTGDVGFFDSTPPTLPPMGGGEDPLPADVDLSVWCAPVGDQGSWGSCTAWATGNGAYNYELNRIYQEYGWDIDDPWNRVSPKHLYVESGILQGFPWGPEYGRYTDQVVEDLSWHGVASEDSVPYDFSYDNDWSPAAEADAQLLTIGDWDEVSCNDEAGIEGVRNVLFYQARPLVMRINLDNDFMYYDGGDVWSYTGPSVGGHAMCVVGFSETYEAFKVRNSWSPDWGENGYVWISYSTFMDESAYVRCFVLSDDYEQEVADRFLASPPPPLAPPANVNATTGEYDDVIVVSWDPVDDATGYRVFRDDPQHEVQVVSETTYSWTDTEITDWKSYPYWVQAYNGFEESDLSACDIGYLGLAPNITGVRHTLEFIELGSEVWCKPYYTASPPLTIAWDFGGGGTPDTSTEYHPWITFNTAGTFDCSVSVENDYGSDSFEFQVEVYDPSGPNEQPVASLAVDPDGGEAPLTVIWNGSASYDPDGSVSRYRFNGDEQDSPYYEQIYFNPGSFNMYLAVRDNKGMWSEQVLLSVDVTESSQAWTVYDFADDAFNSGLLLEIGGLPAVVYSSSVDGRILLRQALDDSWTNWDTPVEVAEISGNSRPLSFTFVDGNPAVLYNHAGDSKAYYVRATNAAGTAWGSPVDPLDGTGDVPAGFSRVRMVDGYPAFSYYEFGDKDLCYIRATDAQGGAWGSPVTVYALNDVGRTSDLEVVSGRPAIGFYDSTNKQLYYTRSDDASGAAWPVSPTLVSSADEAGAELDLSAEAANPALVFYGGNDRLNYVYSGDTEGTDWSNIQLVRTDIARRSVTIAFLNGLPAVSYLNTTENRLYVVRLKNLEGSDLFDRDLVIQDNDLNGLFLLFNIGGRLMTAPWLGYDPAMPLKFAVFE